MRPGCDGKFSYQSYADADRSAKYSRKSRGGNVASYRCQCCGYWHVGQSVSKKHDRKGLRPQ